MIAVLATSLRKCVVLLLLVVIFQGVLQYLLTVAEDMHKGQSNDKAAVQNRKPVKTQNDEPDVKVWSSLQLIHNERSSQHVLALINRTFFPSGHPIVSRISNWIDWAVGDLVLTYPVFNVSEPLFPREEDRKLFYSHKDNREYTDSPPPPKHLAGVIRVIHNAKAHLKIDCGWGSNLKHFEDKEISETPNSSQVLVPILTPDAFSFQHFIDGALPKIIQVMPFLRLADVKLVLEEPRDRIIKDIIRKMQLDEKVVWVNLFEGVKSRIQINTCITPPIHPLLWKAMRQELGIQDEFSQGVSKGKVILVTRRISSNTGRRMQNRHEVIQYLETRYGEKFLEYKPEETLEHTTRAFADARIIIGVHGGALYNLNFAPAECHVIEVMPTSSTGQVPRSIAHTIFWRMAAAIGQRYWRIALKPKDKANNVHIHTDRLTNVLDKIDQMQLGLPTA